MITRHCAYAEETDVFPVLGTEQNLICADQNLQYGSTLVNDECRFQFDSLCGRD